MWIFTSSGFISAVRHREKPSHFMVRARVIDHLRAMLPGHEITESANSDYKYRVTVSDMELKAFMLQQINALQYDNFKNSIADSQYHGACSQVWRVMHQLQPGSYMPPAPTMYSAEMFDNLQTAQGHRFSCPECEEKNYTISVIGDDPARCRCDSCGHEWKPTAPNQNQEELNTCLGCHVEILEGAYCQDCVA